MQHLIDSVRQSVRDQNWYAALTGALALPDITAKTDGALGKDSSTRYVGWFEKYLLPKYTLSPAHPAIVYHGERATIMSGKECYALRCAYLHEGEFDVTDHHKMRDVLSRFEFVVPPSGLVRHCNTLTTPNEVVLQLQVDIFCEDVCSAVEQWLQTRGTDASVAAALASLPRIIIL